MTSHPDSLKFTLRCTVCGTEHISDVNACAKCGNIVQAAYVLDPARVHLSGRGVWRYFDLLPIAARASVVSLGELETPLLRSGALGAGMGMSGLHFKVETSLPTGSYKDRIAAVSMARAAELGRTGWAATSSGNAGAALAAYGVRAGLPGTIYTLERASRSKIAQILTYRPRLRAIRGLGMRPETERETFARVRAMCERENWMMMVTAHRFNPAGMEGAKTAAFEICEQLGRAPDVVYVPVGGGGLLASIWKGFQEWHALGFSASMPRMVAVQGEGCASVVDSWQAGGDMRAIPECRGTVSGLQLADPPDGALALRAVRESGGWAIAVPDADTARMHADLPAREGLFVEPAAAITAAAASLDRASGRLSADALAVCMLTGIGFKVMEPVQAMAERADIPLIDVADIGA